MRIITTISLFLSDGMLRLRERAIVFFYTKTAVPETRQLRQRNNL